MRTSINFPIDEVGRWPREISSMDTRLLLIRHAHVDTGPSPGRLCGSLDLPLSAAGRAQLRALGARLAADEAPDALYTSTLRRAREVAEALTRIWDRDLCLDDAVREIDCGRLDGMPIVEIEREYADLWARNRAQIDDDFTWPDGESYRAFRQRVLDGLGHIAAAHRGQRVAVVTHAGVIAQVLGAIRGRPAAVWELDRPAPLSATEVTWANGAPASVVAFNRRDW